MKAAKSRGRLRRLVCALISPLWQSQKCDMCQNLMNWPIPFQVLNILRRKISSNTIRKLICSYISSEARPWSYKTFYAPAIRRMRKGIKRCPCPSVRLPVRPCVRPCVLPFVHHLGRYFVSATPPTIFSQSFWNFTGVFVKDWRCAWHLDITLRLIFVTFFTVWT